MASKPNFGPLEGEDACLLHHLGLELGELVDAEAALSEVALQQAGLRVVEVEARAHLDEVGLELDVGHLA